jgi:hypothetical protein
MRRKWEGDPKGMRRKRDRLERGGRANSRETFPFTGLDQVFVKFVIFQHINLLFLVLVLSLVFA